MYPLHCFSFFIVVFPIVRLIHRLAGGNCDDIFKLGQRFITCLSRHFARFLGRFGMPYAIGPGALMAIGLLFSRFIKVP